MIYLTNLSKLVLDKSNQNWITAELIFKFKDTNI